MPALLLQFMPYLFEAAKSVPQILDYIHKQKENFQRTDEWTDEMDALYTKSLVDLGLDPAWTPAPSEGGNGKSELGT